jgi:hypothetical protein
MSAASAGDVRANMMNRPAKTTKAMTTNRRISAGRLATSSTNVSNAHLHVDMSDCLAAILDKGPDLSGDMSQNAPLSVP